MAYTNCDITQGIASKTSQSFSNLSLTGGDGEGFEGKLTYDRKVPGHLCNGQNMAYASLSLSGARANLTVNSSNQCHQESNVNYNKIQFSPYTDQIIGYEKGIYSKVADLKGNPHTFTEVWCDNHNTEEKSLDLVIKWEQPGSTAKAKIFDSSTGPQGGASVTVHRSLTPAVIRYDSPTLSLKIQRTAGGRPSHPYQHTGFLKNHDNNSLVYCRLGGQFDSKAPKIKYPIETILHKDRPMESIRPDSDKPIISYKITPSLPKGLNFDSSTGTISGASQHLAPVQTFSIEAFFKFGSVTTSLSLGVGHKFFVSPLASLGKDSRPGDGLCKNLQQVCDLRSAIEEGNAQAPYPVVIHLPGEKILLDGQQFEVKGALKLVGKAKTKIDAQFKSRIFKLQEGGHLWLDSIQLSNGVANGSGGAINALNSSLSLNHVILSNHFTNHREAQGGGIYMRGGTLRVRNSQFLKNKTTRAGQDISGGAIGLSNVKSFVIESSVFKNNESLSGGAIHVLGAGIEEYSHISNVQFEYNSAIFGGAVFMRAPRTIIDHVKFIDNSAHQGGAVFAHWNQELVITDSYFTLNEALNGAAIYNNGGAWKGPSVYILDTEFDQNRVPSWISKAHPQYMGSTLFTLSELTKIGHSSFMDGPDMENCQSPTRTEGSGNYKEHFIDLGQNHGDDNSCRFGDEEQGSPF